MLEQRRHPEGDHRRRRRMAAVVVAVGVGLVAVVVLVVFQPQKLLYDEVVDEAFPIVDPDRSPDAGRVVGTDDPDGADPAADGDRSGGEADADADADAAAGSSEPEPVALGSGEFASRSRYDVQGRATVYALPDGSRTLRLQEFRSTNGPDLFVYLATGGADGSDEQIASDYVDLGRLKGNVGNQNYDVPAAVDLETYDTVVIWCQPFSVAFGVADVVDIAG